MTELHVSQGEHGVVRVFILARPLDLARGATVPLDQIAKWIGAARLNEADVQQLWTGDLAEMSLAGFLAAGYEISADQLAAHEELLDIAIDAHPTLLVIVRSSAFTDRPQTLEMNGPLQMLAALQEPKAEFSFEPLRGPDPQAVLEDPPTKKAPSQAAMSGRIAMYALLAMFALVGLMIWVAG